jgi:hypothetical protein
MAKVKKRPRSGGIESLKLSAAGSRVSLRLHPHVKMGLEFLAKEDQRSLSSYIDRIFVRHLREMLDNEVLGDGEIIGQPMLRPVIRR